ncbi:MAG: hypothetical protein Q9212_002231 [Teloschistes hypoglaucus]
MDLAESSPDHAVRQINVQKALTALHKERRRPKGEEIITKDGKQDEVLRESPVLATTTVIHGPQTHDVLRVASHAWGLTNAGKAAANRCRSRAMLQGDQNGA